jgi:hypothetical protein
MSQVSRIKLILSCKLERIGESGNVSGCGRDGKINIHRVWSTVLFETKASLLNTLTTSLFFQKQATTITDLTAANPMTLIQLTSNPQTRN